MFESQADSLAKDSKSSDEDTVRDKFGATRALRQAIEKKYEMTTVIGKGSYGCVSRGVCRATGREVALKLMIN
jgi:hypothetical protein